MVTHEFLKHFLLEFQKTLPILLRITFQHWTKLKLFFFPISSPSFERNGKKSLYYHLAGCVWIHITLNISSPPYNVAHLPFDLFKSMTSDVPFSADRSHIHTPRFCSSATTTTTLTVVTIIISLLSHIFAQKVERTSHSWIPRKDWVRVDDLWGTLIGANICANGDLHVEIRPKDGSFVIHIRAEQMGRAINLLLRFVEMCRNHATHCEAGKIAPKSLRTKTI